MVGIGAGMTVQRQWGAYEGHFLQGLGGHYTERQQRVTVKKKAVRRPKSASSRSTSSSRSSARSKTSLRAAAPASAPLAVPSAETVSLVENVVRNAVLEKDGFPAFERSAFPVSRVPNWGAMRTPAEWNRSYDKMDDGDFVPVPRYDIKTLTTPLFSLANPITDKTIPLITAKLFYSTHYFGDYNVDAEEFTAVHPGLDLKLALLTPVGAVAGGRVHDVRTNDSLGLHVIIEHRISDTEAAYSIYGHLASTTLAKGDDIEPGQIVGRIGMTGNTTAPHFHLQIDKGMPGEAEHVVYWPSSVPSAAEAAKHVYHPMTFVTQFASGIPQTVTQR